MNVQDRSGTFDLNKYGIGQPVRRTEDPVLVQGQGRYTDDVNLPGQAYAVFVRSRNAHGLIKGIDTSAAKRMPGVLAVYTGKDLEAYGTLKCAVPFKNRDGSEMKKPKRPSLPTDKVRFVGDPVAVVIAETLAQAKDAAEKVLIDYEVLPKRSRSRSRRCPRSPRRARLRRKARHNFMTTCPATSRSITSMAIPPRSRRRLRRPRTSPG